MRSGAERERKEAWLRKRPAKIGLIEFPIP